MSGHFGNFLDVGQLEIPTTIFVCYVSLFPVLSFDVRVTRLRSQGATPSLKCPPGDVRLGFDFDFELRVRLDVVPECR